MKNLKPEQLLSLIDKKQAPSLLLLDGPEAWIKKDIVQRVIEKNLTPESRDLNLERLDGAQDDIAALVNACQSLPFLGDQRVVIIQNAHKISSKEGKILGETLASLSENVRVVFLYDGKAKMREDIPARVSQHGAIVTCWTPFANQLPSWTVAQSKAGGKELDFDAARTLAESCADLEEINNELEKLFLFVGKKKKITLDDVYQHGLPDGSGDLNQLEEALWSRNSSEAINQAERLSEMGVRAEGALPVFERFFRSLALARHILDSNKGGQPEVFQALGIHYKKLKQGQLIRGLKNYTRAEIRSGYEKTVQAHYDLKTGALDSRSVLTLMALNVTKRDRV